MEQLIGLTIGISATFLIMFVTFWCMPYMMNRINQQEELNERIHKLIVSDK